MQTRLFNGNYFLRLLDAAGGCLGGLLGSLWGPWAIAPLAAQDDPKKPQEVSKRPQEAPRESSGTIRTHTGPYGSIRIHTDPSQINFQTILYTFLTFFGKVCQKNVKSQSRHLASKQASGAFATCQAQKVSMDEPMFSPNAMRNCLIINRNVSKVALEA